jgi:hypothetical protein
MIVLSTVLLVLAIGLAIYLKRPSRPGDGTFGGWSSISRQDTRRVIEEFQDTPIRNDHEDTD